MEHLGKPKPVNKGNNIAILPKNVDKSLRFSFGAEFELDRAGNKINIENKFGICLWSIQIEVSHEIH